MKVLLTGITGNLGQEIAQSLSERGIEIVALIRKGKIREFDWTSLWVSAVIEADLIVDNSFVLPTDIQGIVHCAGEVHFGRSGNKNEQMMLKVIELAQKRGIHIYFVSTAFVYRPDGYKGDFNNQYELDKFNSEKLLMDSGLPFTILRPSVLVGNSSTGRIGTFTGYYQLVGLFLSKINGLKNEDELLRFPRMTGDSNMVPVDQAAKAISDIVEKQATGLYYVVNPNPPTSSWVLSETLSFFGVKNRVEILDITFEDFEKLDLSEAEKELYKFASIFKPYWSLEYKFPDSVCTENLITQSYLKMILRLYSDIVKNNE
jgi:nucleoside-diphosphate-sugar epimerase